MGKYINRAYLPQPGGNTHITVPKDVKIIHIGLTSYSTHAIWFEQDDEVEQELIKLHCVYSGSSFPPVESGRELLHIGSYFDGGYIRHIYREITRESTNDHS